MKTEQDFERGECPTCGVPYRVTNGRWHCDKCEPVPSMTRAEKREALEKAFAALGAALRLLR